MRNRKFISLMVFVLTLSMLLSGCNNAKESKPEVDTETEGTEVGEANPEATKKPTILKVANTATVTTWDPSISYSTETAYISNIYEPLLYANPAGSASEFSPALAEKWEHSDNGMEWTFHIRQGVTFHDGAALNAEAVKKSIERTMTINKGAAFLWSSVKQIDVVDEFTVKFLLKDPVPFDRIVSAGNAAWIMSPDAADKDEAWFNEGNAAGTGPWKLSSYKPDQEIILVKNNDYWGEWQTNFETVVTRIVAEGVVQQQMLTSGEVDLATNIPTENIAMLEAQADMHIERVPSFYNFLGFFNTQKAPLDNKLVRQALSYAIPYDAIIEVATKGAGTQAKGPVPKTLWPSDESLKKYETNITKAKELIAQSGIDVNGLTLELTHAAENEAEKRFTPLIKEGFAELGIDLKVSSILWNQQWEKGKGDPKKAQDIFVLMWWPSFSDGYDNLKAMFYTEEAPAWNLAYWYNKKYDQLIDDAYALSGMDIKTSKKLYIEAQELLIEEAPAIYFYDVQSTIPMKANLKKVGDAFNPNYPNVIFYSKLATE